LDFLAAEGVNIHVEATAGNHEETRSDLPTVNGAKESNGNRGLPDAAPDRVLQFQISEGSDARIHFRGRPDRLAIKKLIVLLDLSIDTFPAN
jgi:hypothetical protein